MLLPIHLPICVARGMCTKLSLCSIMKHNVRRFHAFSKWLGPGFTEQPGKSIERVERCKDLTRWTGPRSSGRKRKRAFTSVSKKKKAPRPFKVGYLTLRHVRVMPSHHTLSWLSQWPKSDPGTGANVSSGSAGCRSYQCLEMNGLSGFLSSESSLSQAGTEIIFCWFRS